MLSWRKGDWCDEYKLIVASDSTFLHPIIQDSSIVDTVKELKGLADFGKYYWKIQGRSLEVRTQWSPVWNFTTIFNAPDNLQATVTGKNKIKLSWRDNSVSEFGYVIERKSESDFMVLSTIQANSTQFTDSTLTVTGSYQYRLKAIANGGESEYSNIATAAITGINDPASVINDFVLEQNFPNPFNPTTTIQYSLPEQADVKLTIVNLLGIVIKTFSFNSQPAGHQNVVWDGKDFNNEKTASGPYLCKLKATTINGKVTERIVKMMLLK